jgi:hypothetical protein
MRIAVYNSSLVFEMFCHEGTTQRDTDCMGTWINPLHERSVPVRANSTFSRFVVTGVRWFPTR